MLHGVQQLSKIIPVAVGFAIVVGALTWHGTLEPTAENAGEAIQSTAENVDEAIKTVDEAIKTVDEAIKTACEARETALSELEKAVILDQTRLLSPEHSEFLSKVYDAGNVSYCDAEKLQMLLGADGQKLIDRLRKAPCEAYSCLTE